MTKVVLLEYIDEYEEFQTFIKNNGLDVSDFIIVALEYKLQAHLRKLGINHKNTLSYFGNNSFERILSKFENIRQYTESNFVFTDKNGISNAYVTELQHYLELTFNYMAKIIEILQNIHKENNKLELYACAKTYFSNSVFISTDRLLGLLVEQYAKKNNVAFYSFGYSNNYKENVSSRNSRSAGESSIYLFFLTILKTYLKIFKKSSVLIPTRDYGFNKLLAGIRERNPHAVFIAIYDDEKARWHKRYGGLISGLLSNVFYIDISDFSSDINSPEENTLRNKILSLFERKSEPSFEFCSIDLRDFMKKKVEAGFVEHLYKMIAWSRQLHHFVNQFDLKIFMSPFGRGIWSIAAELLNKTQRVSLFVSHGTHPIPTNQYHEISIFNMCRGFMLGDYSHIAISTPIQESHLHYFKDKYKWIRNNEIRSGPLIFASIIDENRLKNRASLGFLPYETVIVHAVSLKLKGQERYYFLETIDEYFSGLADLVDAVNRIDNLKLIIRLHPGFDLSEEEISLFLPASEKYIISKTGKFEDILSAADLLVSYSSTTIDEALINKIPVLLYDKWNRYNHFNTGVYEGPESSDIFPVCYINSKHKLQSGLEFLIKKMKLLKKGDIDISKYKYMESYEDNFYKFTEKCLKTGGNL